MRAMVEAMDGFVVLPKVKWNEDFWSEAQEVRVPIRDIANYQPWRLTKPQEKVGIRNLTKVMLRNQAPEMGDEEFSGSRSRSGLILMIVMVDVKLMDMALGAMRIE